jgi:hypothetical protein
MFVVWPHSKYNLEEGNIQINFIFATSLIQKEQLQKNN